MATTEEKRIKKEEEIDWREVNEKIDKYIANVGNDSDALIEVLHKVQALLGYIPKRVQKKIAKDLNLAPGKISSVMSFYAHFSDKPQGKYQIAICKGTACYVKGSVDIIEKIEEEYGLSSGDTTDDGIFSLEVVRCLGACGLAPVMTVNGKAHGLLNPDKAVKILEKYKNGEM